MFTNLALWITIQSPWNHRLITCLVVWNMTFIFPIILGMSSSQLPFLFFKRGGEKPTNQSPFNSHFLLLISTLFWSPTFSENPSFNTKASPRQEPTPTVGGQEVIPEPTLGTAIRRQRRWWLSWGNRKSHGKSHRKTMENMGNPWKIYRNSEVSGDFKVKSWGHWT